MKMTFLKPRRALVLLVVAQLAALSASAQSQRARERASDNARFNRSAERDTDRDQDRNRDDRRSNRNVSDEQFLAEAYQRSQLELKLAHTAVQVSKDESIQKLGHRIINEHNRANEDLKKLATTKNVTLDTTLSGSDQREYDRLSKLTGTEFDRAYRDHLNSDYKRTIQMFQDAGTDARDTQVRNFASQYATTFGEHAQTIGITGLNNNSRDRDYVRGSDNSSASSRSTTSTGPLAQKDEQFLKKVYRTSRTHSQAAQLATRNSRDRQIQTMAQDIVRDNERMDRDIQDIAQRRGLELPRLNENQQDELSQLRKLNGNEFDREFNDYLSRTQKNTLEAFDEATKSSDPEVRSFALKYRDGMQQNLRGSQRPGDGTRR